MLKRKSVSTQNFVSCNSHQPVLIAKATHAANSVLTLPHKVFQSPLNFLPPLIFFVPLATSLCTWAQHRLLLPHQILKRNLEPLYVFTHHRHLHHHHLFLCNFLLIFLHPKSPASWSSIIYLPLCLVLLLYIASFECCFRWPDLNL
jgi:hypothetical protein